MRRRLLIAVGDPLQSGARHLRLRWLRVVPAYGTGLVSRRPIIAVVDQSTRDAEVLAFDSQSFTSRRKYI